MSRAKLYLILFLFLFAGSRNSFAQNEFLFEPVAAIQAWTSFTHNASFFNDSLGSYENFPNQLNFLIRRSRIGLKFKKGDYLKVKVVGAFDQVGRDPAAGTVGGINNGAFPKFGLWDAYFDWKINKANDYLHLVGGYFTPSFSRESLISAFDVSSMEKSFSQWYIRKHLVGKGPGRSTGIALGGLKQSTDNKQRIKYVLGVHNGALGNTPLISTRFVYSFGNLRTSSFRIGEEPISFEGARKIDVGFSASYQKAPGLVLSSMASGLDIQILFDGFSLQGEWYLLSRNKSESLEEVVYRSQTGFLRSAYRYPINKIWLEPSVMWMFFRGGLDNFDQTLASDVDSFSGTEDTFDIGLNCYLKERKLKVYVHYTWRAGNAGYAGNGADVNMYYFQKEIGSIHRGNWVGLGLNLII